MQKYPSVAYKSYTEITKRYTMVSGGGFAVFLWGHFIGLGKLAVEPGLVVESAIEHNLLDR